MHCGLVRDAAPQGWMCVCVCVCVFKSLYLMLEFEVLRTGSQKGNMTVK